MNRVRAPSKAPRQRPRRQEQAETKRARLARRRVMFARVQRLSPLELTYLDQNFDPGPGYDIA